MDAGDNTIAGFAAELAAKQPTPGGGAAAAVTAALGCATGAMACRYTTGERYATVSAIAETCALQLDGWRIQALALADRDAAAYAAVRAAKMTKDQLVIAAAASAAAEVPAQLIRLCGEAASVCADFRPRCNPWLVSDIDSAIHLLAGAGRAAWRTLLINQPTDDVAAFARAQLAALEVHDAEVPQP